MNFLNPAVFGRLPPRERINVWAVYSMIVADANPNPRKESFRTQASLARFFGCNVSTIKRHERRLVRRGLLELVHHPKTNRRSLVVVQLAHATTSYQHRGQIRNQEGGRFATKSSGEATSLSMKKSSEEARAARAPDQRGSSIPRETRPPLPDFAKRKLADPLRRWMRVSAIDKNGEANVHELAYELVRCFGVDQTVARLAHIETRNAGIADAKRRAAMSVGFLRRMVTKAEERSGPRTGKTVRVASH